MAEKNELMIVDEQSLKDKVYVLRGQQVMLDMDLADIYGYSVSAFNQQVKRNIGRFPEDFMFQLTKEEIELVKSQFVTSRDSDFYMGQSGGRRKPPYAFTEQGVYMVATVLRGEIAERQTIAIMRAFRAMRRYLQESPQIIPYQEIINLSHKQNLLEADMKSMKDTMVTKADLSDFMKLFDSGIEHEEILILNGEPFKADLAYQKIYRRARSKIIVVDDYISTKTLEHLLHAKQNVKFTIISDNKARPPLRQTEYNDYLTENPGRSITFVTTAKKAHDRYIILDYGTKAVKVYHCGASSKDAGKKITTITEIKDISGYADMIRDLLSNPALVLK